LAREDVKILTVYVDLSVICVICVDLEVWTNNTKQKLEELENERSKRIWGD
jgi:hypothetical protein